MYSPTNAKSHTFHHNYSTKLNIIYSNAQCTCKIVILLNVKYKMHANGICPLNGEICAADSKSSVRAVDALPGQNNALSCQSHDQKTSGYVLSTSWMY